MPEDIDLILPDDLSREYVRQLPGIFSIHSLSHMMLATNQNLADLINAKTEEGYLRCPFEEIQSPIAEGAELFKEEDRRVIASAHNNHKEATTFLSYHDYGDHQWMIIVWREKTIFC